VFTGIVEEIGVVRQARPNSLVVAATLVTSDLKLGDSVCVDGTCLTVVERSERTFAVEIQPETSRRTNLGGLVAGRRVNLERALAVGSRLGGHIVQGHIDSTGRIAELRPDGEGLVVKIAAPVALMRYIVPKGFIAVNGISLTVVDVGDDWFTVALIRFTRDHVALLDEGAGSAVNLEVDILAKYVESLLASHLGGTGGHAETGLTLEKLQQAGFA
jgi:riboflavin synthase